MGRDNGRWDNGSVQPLTLATPEEARSLDAAAARDFGLPGLLLMEAAAEGVARRVDETVVSRGCRKAVAAGCGNGMAAVRGHGVGCGVFCRRKAFVVCGKGNNGGDGFATARKLALRGWDVEAALTADRKEISGDALANMLICERMGIPIAFPGNEPGETLRAVSEGARRADAVIDAIFGTGFRGAPRGAPLAAITAINECDAPVFSIDAPSGLDCLTGSAPGECVRAAATFALGSLKVGLVVGPDAWRAGAVEALDIGIPPAALEGAGIRAFVSTRGFVRALLCGRPLDFAGCRAQAASGCPHSAAVRVHAAASGCPLEFAGCTHAASGCPHSAAVRVQAADGCLLEFAGVETPGGRVAQAGFASGVCGRVLGRPADAHKGSCGRVAILTGSSGMTGAGCIAADAALRAGAGLAYLAVPAALSPIYELGVREAITVPLGAAGAAGMAAPGAASCEASSFTAECAREALAWVKAVGANAACIGPGMSRSSEVAAGIRAFVDGADIPLVIDADALSALAQDPEWPSPSPGHVPGSGLCGEPGSEPGSKPGSKFCGASTGTEPAAAAGLGILHGRAARGGAVLTPHEGEMARLLGTTPEAVRADRLETARSFAVKWGVALLLKGSRTIVALPDGSAYVNPTGNPGMATAGSGDALAGIIASFLGAGLGVGEAAVAGAYVHGLAGDVAASRLGEASVRATDIVACIPDALRSLE